MMKHGQVDISHLADSALFSPTLSYSVLLCPTVPLSSILCYGITVKTVRMAVGPQRWEDTAPSLLVFLVFWRYMRWESGGLWSDWAERLQAGAALVSLTGPVNLGAVELLPWLLWDQRFLMRCHFYYIVIFWANFHLFFQVWSNFQAVFSPEYRRTTYMMMAVWFSMSFRWDRLTGDRQCLSGTNVCQLVW